MYEDTARDRYSAPPPKKNKKERVQGIVLLSIMLLIIASAVFFFANAGVGGGATSMVDIPPVETLLVSQTGESHIFNATVTLELSGGAAVDADALHNEVLGAITNLSYDDVSGIQGMEVVRDAVFDRLDGYIDDGEIVAIWLTDVLSGQRIERRGTGGRGRFTRFGEIFQPRN